MNQKPLRQVLLMVCTLALLSVAFWNIDGFATHECHYDEFAPNGEVCPEHDDDSGSDQEDTPDEGQEAGEGNEEEQEPAFEDSEDTATSEEEGLDGLIRQLNPWELFLEELPIENELKTLISQGLQKRYLLFLNDLNDPTRTTKVKVWDGLLLLQDPSEVGQLARTLIKFPNGDTSIQWYYQNPDQSTSKLIGSANGQVTGVITFWLDGKSAIALDLDGDRTIDFFNLILADSQELIFAEDIIGLAFLDELLRGINPLCDPSLQDATPSKGNSFGDSAHPGTWLTGCRNQEDEPGEDSESADADPSCGGGGGDAGLSANEDEERPDDGSNTCGSRCHEDGQICVAACTTGGMAAVPFGGPAAVVGSLACLAFCVVVFEICNDRCEEDSATAETSPPTEEPSDNDSDDDRFFDTDGDGTDDAEDTNGDGEPDTSCNPCGRGDAGEDAGEDSGGDSDTQEGGNSTPGIDNCGINNLDPACSDGRAPGTVEEWADALLNSAWEALPKANPFDQNGNDCGCGQGQEQTPETPGPGPEPGPDDPGNDAPCDITSIRSSDNKDAPGRNQSAGNLKRDNGGCFSLPGSFAQPGPDGNCVVQVSVSLFGSIIRVHGLGCEGINCDPAEAGHNQGGT